MDASCANSSVAMSELAEDTSLLNHNVSFNSSTMDVTLAKSLPADIDSDESLPNLSFSLSEEERQQLKLQQEKAKGRDGNQHSSLKDLSNNQSSSSLMEESSLMDDSEPVISIDDTVDEQPEQVKEPELQLQLDSVSEQSVNPPLVYFERELIELGRRCWPSTAQAQHYTKGCYWSPDGTCLLLPVHMDGMHVLELPLDLYDSCSSGINVDRALSQLQSAVHVPEGGTVYDCVWYPLMNSQQPDSCFWLATRQHEPIHMWDAFDGKLRCSYSGYDEVDEVVAAISLAFSSDGQKIYAGYKRCLKIFDTSRPGRSYDEYSVKFAVSCIAQTLEHPHTVTCGNWRGYIQHYDLRCSPKQGPLFTLGGHTGGITQLRYTADTAGNWQLFSGARKCPKLLQWDMRNYKQPLYEFPRRVDTNQRIQFDLSPQHSWLASGDTEGSLNLWNLERSPNDSQALQLPLHADCCNGIGFHPTLPILASSSGQFHFVAGDKHEDCNNTTLLESTVEQPTVKSVVDYENSVMLLWCGNTADL